MRSQYINFQNISCFDPGGPGISVLPGGSANQTLYWNGTAWAPSSVILNNNTNAAIGGALASNTMLNLTGGTGSSGTGITMQLGNTSTSYMQFKDNQLAFLYGKLYLKASTQTPYNYTDFEATAQLMGLESYMQDTDSFTEATRYFIQSQGSSAVTNKSYTGIRMQMQNSATSTTTNQFMGLYIETKMDSNTGTVSGVKGIVAELEGNGTQAITNMYGFYSYVHLNTTIPTNVYGYYVFQDAGNPTNIYGIYIDNLTGTNKWGIYQKDPGATNFFAGPIQLNGQTGGAPTSGTFVSVPLTYYGNANDHILATPDKWLKINLDGVVHSIPAYT